MTRSRPTLLSIGTALPRYRVTQEQARCFQERLLRSLDLPRDELRRTCTRLERIYRGSGIEFRSTVIADYLTDDPAAHEFFPRNELFEPFPGTAYRMRVFESECVPLALAAGRQAIERADLPPRAITHLVLSSCTGLFSPGPDILLVAELGLSRHTQRTVLGFMGCNAGLNGMRSAAQIIAGDPDAVVLQVAVELCTLHLQKSADPEVLVAQALFADGAAAALWSGAARGGAGLASVVDTRSQLVPDTLELMTWNIGDTGFAMRLDRSIPARLAEVLPGFVSDLVVGDRATVWGWALHPGGRAIIEAACACLELPAAAGDTSLEILRHHGNLSSATILFVLDALLAGRPAPGPVVAVGFGPGLTLEGVLFEPVR